MDMEQEDANQKSPKTKGKFWTKERQVPGQSTIEATGDTYFYLDWLHPPAATAMVLGGALSGYATWWLLHGSSAILAWVAAIGVGFVGLWLGLLIYLMLRFAVSFFDW